MIEVKKVTKKFSNGKGIFDISFSINEGDVFGFLGPNGAGKSTTIRHLMGFMKPQSGSLSIKGLDCWGHSPDIQKFTGYLPGEMAFIEKMTGKSFLNLLAGMRNLKDRNREKDLIDRFQFDPNIPIRKMSKGMKQKVGIVAAFMHDPAILILDEPTSGLDPLMQRRFVELIVEERERGKTILMSSHYFPEIERTCNRASIIKDGRILKTETMSELQKLQRKQIEVTFSTDKEALLFCTNSAFTIVKRDQQQVTLTLGDEYNKFIKALQPYEVVNLNIHTQALEEVFMHLYDRTRKGGSES